MDESRAPVGSHRLFSHWPTETTRPALFTALRTGFADQLLREVFTATRALRTKLRQDRGLPPGTDASGLGKLLMVAPDQINARRYAEVLRGWVPSGQSSTAQLATSDERDSHETLARFWLTADPPMVGHCGSAANGSRQSATLTVDCAVHRSRRPLTRLTTGSGPPEKMTRTGLFNKPTSYPK